MTRRRIAVVLGLPLAVLAALAAAFVLRRGADGPAAEVGAPAPGDRMGDPMSADARPAAVPLAAGSRGGRRGGRATADRGATVGKGGGAMAAFRLPIELLDAEGRPVADVEVRVIGGVATRGGAHMIDLPFAGRTDAAGRTHLDLGSSGASLLLARVPGGASHVLLQAILPAEGVPVRWVIPRSARVVGIVRQPTGEPAPGVEIVPAKRPACVAPQPIARSDPDEESDAERHERELRALGGGAVVPEVHGPWWSAADGRFDLWWSGSGPIDLVFTQFGAGDLSRFEVASARVTADGAPLDVRLVPFVPPAGGVVARFVWVDGTAPSMDDLNVDLRKRDDPQWGPAARTYVRATLADPSIVWRMDEGLLGRGLPPGTYRLVVQPRGYRVVERSFEVADAEVDLGDLVFDRGATLVGRLELPALAPPLRDLTVSLWPVDGPRERAQREVKLSPERAFRISGLLPGAYVLKAEGVDVLRNGLRFEALEPIEVPAEGRLLERSVPVVRMGLITVQILQPPRPGTDRWIGGEVRIDSADGSGYRRRTTLGSNGDAWREVPCGTYDVVVERDRAEVRATVTVGPPWPYATLLLDGAPDDRPTLRPSMR